jgi:hypothetical protein
MRHTLQGFVLSEHLRKGHQTLLCRVIGIDAGVPFIAGRNPRARTGLPLEVLTCVVQYDS